MKKEIGLFAKIWFCTVLAIALGVDCRASTPRQCEIRCRSQLAKAVAWVIGQVSGVCVDAQDHVFTLIGMT